MSFSSAGRSLEQTVAAIEALDLTPIKFKATRSADDDGYGWTRQYADRMELAYKRYLILHARYPEMTLAPERDIDRFWHMHILDTRKYAADCDATFGHFLHHFPYLGLRGEGDAQALQDAFEAMQRLYAQEFGEPMVAAQRDAAWCSADRPQLESAWCSADQPQATAAWCSADGAQAKAAWCSVEGAQAKAAWCSVEGAQAKAAWCSADKPQARAAWCSIEQTAGALKSAWCSIEQTKVQARAAWCSIEQPKTQARAAWCSVEQPKAQAKAAWCSVEQPASQANAAWCSIESPKPQAAWCSVETAIQAAWCSIESPRSAVAANDMEAVGDLH
jgi:hypothetical protein